MIKVANTIEYVFPKRYGLALLSDPTVCMQQLLQQ
jgi:hypothetical protein